MRAGRWRRKFCLLWAKIASCTIAPGLPTQCAPRMLWAPPGALAPAAGATRPGACGLEMHFLQVPVSKSSTERVVVETQATHPLVKIRNKFFLNGGGGVGKRCIDLGAVTATWWTMLAEQLKSPLT